MLYTALCFFSLVQSVIGFTLLSSSVMRFSNPVKKRIIIGLLVMLCGISFLYYIIFTRGEDAVAGFAILIILGVGISWFLICGNDTFFVSAFSFLTCVNIYISISYIGDMTAIHSSGVPYITEYILIRTVIYGLVVPLLFRFIRPRFRRLVNTLGTEWRGAAPVPLLFLILQILLLYYPVPYWDWSPNNWTKIIVIVAYALFLSVYFLLYIQANTIIEKYSLEKRQLLMAQQSKLWESELFRQKAGVALAAQQRHDMHHHNAVIIGMLENEDKEGLTAYLQSYQVALNRANSDKFCLNPIVNSILNLYFVRAKVAGIKIVFHVFLPETIGIDNIDLTCVFGNVLENALEGCLRLEPSSEKEIIVTAKFIDNRLRLQVENSCRTDIDFDGELPITQKQGGGMGTRSILYTAERYDGTAGFSIIRGKFITQIILNAHE